MSYGELKPGDKLVFMRDLMNPAGFHFERGKHLILIEPTGMAPYGFKSAITNWLADGPNGKTVWSSIYYCLEMGYLKRV